MILTALTERLETLVFPARAGMIRSSSARRPHDGSIPRESGDDPAVTHVATTPRQCIPRESGDDPAVPVIAVVPAWYSPRERG